MARHSAINAVAEAVVTALNVAALRALCQGGVYRNRPQAQTPPFISVGPCSEQPDDAFGTHYGAIVTVPIHVITSGADANGESRAAGVLDKVLELIDEPSVLTVVGWTVHNMAWLGTTIGPDENLLMLTGDPSGIEGVATFAVQVTAL